MPDGTLFVLSGPSGSGKDTILKEVLAATDIAFSISTITRPMRPGETAGEKYNFISREAFEKLLSEGAFLEHNQFVGNYYGTPKAPVEACLAGGRDMILEIDVNGAAQIREKMPEAISIFIMPPSYAELQRRLSGRGTDDDDVIESRMRSAIQEIRRGVEYDYIVVNDRLDKAVRDVLHIIAANRLTVDKQQNLIDEVLSKC